MSDNFPRPDFANRYSIKILLLSVEATLRNGLEYHLPPASDLDADDCKALNDILRAIRSHTDKIHDTLTPPGT